VPFVIETPGGPEGHAADVKLLKSLRDAPDASPAAPAPAG
jgi:deoxyribonuclease-4